MPRITLIALDADDTLWENETVFRWTEARFAELLAPHGEGEAVRARLFETEKRNLETFGFGVKGFTLSMIETALDLGGDQLPISVVREILAEGHRMLRHPVETLPGVRETLQELAATRRLMLVTKGDLFDQERKLAASGLGDLFSAVEIVSDKTIDTYRRIFERQGVRPKEAVMVGNSMRSDILPALGAGAFAVHVPHAMTWDYEHAEAPLENPRFHGIETLAELPLLIGEIEAD
ncbi:HAD family hydrolase [Aureimonas jatrophae]|uniref:Putative hydrolase of the HAD superfamily n=1 Tax=Aureimonas jatrophae TaxID=1166073 RepID=A0A1H0LL70_9HYPH|nr:HAD family hydrolase [Aureimonas jatrophae]MBB3952567.1 putative hydrolase of the HAD superfamily [Aureimonas jatrophae]SDO68904.1 putative hydrolase of the HAD superfamily [Aureimonas jatrophae]